MVPPAAYKTFLMASKPKRGIRSGRAWKHRLKNRFFRLTLDPSRGSVQSRGFDKHSGRELVDANARRLRHTLRTVDRDQVQGFVKAYVKIDVDWAFNELGKPSMPPAAEKPYCASSAHHFTLRIEQDRLGATRSERAAPVRLPAVETKVGLHRDLLLWTLEITVYDKVFDAWPRPAGFACHSHRPARVSVGAACRSLTRPRRLCRAAISINSR